MVKATNVARAPSTPTGKATTAKATSSARKRKSAPVVNVSASSDDDEHVKAEVKDENKDDIKPPVSKRLKREAAPRDMKEQDDEEGAFSVRQRLCDIPLWPGTITGTTGNSSMLSSDNDDDDDVQFLGVYSGGADFYGQRTTRMSFKEEQQQQQLF